MFEQGITYPDIITLNFTVTVDPYEERLIGSGDESSTIIVSPTCSMEDIDTSDVDDFPKTCGDMLSIPVKTEAPGRSDHALLK